MNHHKRTKRMYEWISGKASALICLLSLAMTACEDLSNKPLKTSPIDLIVVDGNITSQRINHLITLSFPYQELNSIGAPVTGASVSVAVDSLIYPLTESPVGSGLYYTPVFGAITGKIYTLRISWQGQMFTAQDSPPAVETMDPMTLQKNDSLYTVIESPSGSQANFIRYIIQWQNTKWCKPGSECAEEVYYYDLKSTDVNQIFEPNKTDFYFPQQSTIIRTKYSLSPAYRSFLRSMVSETEWSGGLFDVQHAPVETNLSQGAIGFFAVSTVVADTTVIQ